MIEITFGKMNIPENERFIGFAGDNLYSTKTFLMKNIDDENCIYRLYLTFDDGTTNYFLLDSKVENGSTYLTWEISEDHIMKSGLVKAQIKAFCEDERIFHTSYDYFIVAPTAEYDDEISEKENSEFLDYEKRLNEILSYISSHENDFVPSERTIAGLSLSRDITTELLCDSMKVYPILRLTFAPTKTTAGKIGQLAFEKSTTNGTTFVYRLYICTAISSNGEYIWMNITSDNPANNKAISNVLINANGELEISFSDGENKNLGRITGADGKDGEDGEDGYTPIKGVDYFDGKDGKDGENGTSSKISVTSFSGGTRLSIDNGDNDGAQVVNIFDGEDGYTPVLGVDYFTESDKAYIVSSVIDSLGGNPVFGIVDENNNIVVSGNLGTGTYIVKYELEDGTTVDIGELTLGGTNEPETPEETNYFNKDTAQLNFRLGSSGSPSAYDGMVTTDFIPVDSSMVDKLFRINGITLINSDQYTYCTRVVYYDENKNKLAENNNTESVSSSSYNVSPWLSSMTSITNGYMRIAMVIKDNVALTSDDVANLTITLE